MSFLNAMQERYTTKKYDHTKKIDPKKIEELKEILRLSPSSINSQPWQFTFVQDEETKERLSKVSWVNTPKILACDTVVVFSSIASIEAFEKQIKKELPEGAVKYYEEFLKPMGEEHIKHWFGRQVYLSLGVFLSACATMDIDATPMEGIEPENYDDILGQSTYRTLVAVAIGKRDKEDTNQPSIKPKSRRDIQSVIEVF